MADPASAPDDPTNPEYYKSFHPAYQQGKGSTGVPGDSSIDFARELELAGTQLGIGALGLPALGGRLAWGAGHAIAPSYIPPVAPWMSPGGPEGYANALTNWSGVVPQGPGERILAGSARGAGAAIPFGPRAMAIGGAGGGVGEALTEAGWPRLGQAADFAGGLYGGYRGMATGGWFGRTSRPTSVLEPPAGTPVSAPAGPVLNPDAIMGGESGNVIPFPRGGAAPAPRPTPTPAPSGAAPAAAAPAAGRSEYNQMETLINLEQQANRLARAHLLQSTYAPLTRWLGPAQAIANRWLARGALSSDPGVRAATSTASRILGLGAGTALGYTEQDQRPPISWQVSPSQ